MINNVNTITQYLTVFVAVFSAVITLVKAVEVPGFGDEKKQVVLNTIDVIYDEICKLVNVKVSKEFVLNIADKFVELCVAFFNMVGVFKKEEK